MMYALSVSSLKSMGFLQLQSTCLLVNIQQYISFLFLLLHFPCHYTKYGDSTVSVVGSAPVYTRSDAPQDSGRAPEDVPFSGAFLLIDLLD